jgi:hypothetical protein
MPPNTKKKPDPDPAAADPTPPAIPELVEIGFRGETFTIPKDRDEWDTEGYLQFLQAWETNKYQPWLLAAKLLLGPGQWAKLLTLGAKRKDFDDFLTEFIPASTEKCEG